MKKNVFIQWVLISLIPCATITSASLQALIFKAALFKNIKYPETSIVLFSDMHDLCAKDINIMQMENFLENITKLSLYGKNKISVITESIFLNGINLNKGNEASVAQKFYDTYKFYPATKKELLPNFNASTTDLSLINPNLCSISTWITWDLPIRFVKEKSNGGSLVSLDALDPRQKIFFFADILCAYLNHPNCSIKPKMSLGDIYDFVDSLLAKAPQISGLSSLCDNKRKQLKTIEVIFGNKEKRKQIFPYNAMTFLPNNKEAFAELLRLFGIRKENDGYRVSTDLMVDDSYLGKDLLEIATMNIILNNLNNKNSQKIVIVLAGVGHTKFLRFILLQLGFTCIHKFPSREMKGKLTGKDLVEIFDKIPSALNNKDLYVKPTN